MSYIDISRSKRGETMPANVLRLRQKSMAISPNLGEKFQAGRTTTNAGYEKVSIGLAADKDAGRIKLIPNSISGFSFRTFPNGDVLTTSIPVQLRRLGLPVGDYRLVDEHNLEFELAR